MAAPADALSGQEVDRNHHVLSAPSATWTAGVPFTEIILRTRDGIDFKVDTVRLYEASEIFKDMGKGMWRSGKGFGKVGALFAGIECVIESVRPSICRVLPY